jgi:hypothetical protein
MKAAAAVALLLAATVSVLPAAAVVGEDGTTYCPDSDEAGEPVYCIMREPAVEACEDLVSASFDGEARIAVLWSPVTNATHFELHVAGPDGNETIGGIDPHVTGLLYEDAKSDALYTFTLTAHLASGEAVTFCPATAIQPTQVPFFTGPLALALAVLGIAGVGFTLRRK